MKVVHMFSLAGGVDQVRLEGYPRYPHSHGGSQPAALCYTQRTQHLETARVQRSDERFRHIHVPDQHGSNEKPGKDSASVLVGPLPGSVRHITFQHSAGLSQPIRKSQKANLNWVSSVIMCSHKYMSRVGPLLNTFKPKWRTESNRFRTVIDNRPIPSMFSTWSPYS